VQILDRYVTRTFLSTFGVVLLFVLGIFFVIHTFSLLDSILESREQLEAHGMSVAGVMLRYYAVSIPFFFQQLAPFITVIAATIALIRLMRGNELTPMIVAGRSPARITMPIYVCGGIIAVGMLVIQEWAVPCLAEAQLRLKRYADGEFEEKVDDLPFLVDGNGNSWSVGEWMPGVKTIRDVKVRRFRDPGSGKVVGTLSVERARYDAAGAGGPGWYPEEGFLRHQNSNWEERLPEDRPLVTDLLPEALDLEAARESREAGKMLSLSEAARIVKRYPDLPRQRVAFHSLITWPLGSLLLLFLGLPVIFRLGERNLFVGIGVSLGLCAGYFGVNTICQDLGNRATLPPTVAAWLPVVIFVSLAISLQDARRG
jgi:lipopolysaccharide export LptBFGC system permease protein LptF